MKLFVVLLAIGFSSSEKLNRGYLPPPGAKLAGGSSADLQTPLEYPKDDLTFGANDNGYPNVEVDQNKAAENIFENHDSVLTGGYKTDDSITTENSNEYTHTTLYPINSYDTTIPEMVYDANTQNRFGNRYPMKSISIMDRIDMSGYHYGKPETLPIIAAKDEILSNYNPNVFGMYGGNPMIIKTEVNNMFGPDESFDHPLNDLNTSNHFDVNSENQSSVHSIPDSSQKNPSTFKPVDTTTSVNPFRRRPQRPQTQSDRTAIEINYKNIINPNEYTYSFDTSNGIHMDETASTIDGVKASGSYSYTGDDGKLYKIVYTADEKGFQPKGSHLPTPPPIPEAIQTVIEQAELDRSAGIYHDGSYDEEKYGHMKYQGPVERYIQSMLVNPKPRNRNRGIHLRKKHQKPKDTEDYYVTKENVLRSENEFDRPKHSLNGRFGMKNLITVEETKPMNTLKIQNSYKQNLREPIQKLGGENHKNNNKASGKDVNMFKNKNLGYFYVPPRQIFIEGRLQTDRENVNQFSTVSEDLKTKSGFYYVDQRNNSNSKNIFYTTSDGLATEGPESNVQTLASNYYGSTNKDLNAANNIEEEISRSTNEVTIITTPQSRKNILNTIAYNEESTKKYQEDIFSTEENDENAVSFTEQRLDFNIISTTPMPPEAKYPNVLSDSNQYQLFNPSEKRLGIKLNTKYSEDGGDLITKPDVQVFFEDLPSSTYSPICVDCVVNDIQRETIPNIKVDGFGRPIQDNQQFISNKGNFGFSESPFKADDKKAPYYNFEEPLKDRAVLPKDDIINYNVDQREVTKNMDGEEYSQKIIGEDFSGPKQLQRYDVTAGYFY